MNMKNKINVLLLVLILLVFSVAGTYCAFVYSHEYSTSIEANELSTTFLNNEDFLEVVQALDSTITSIDKTTDLHRVTTIPTVELDNDNIVSTSNSSVPTFLWVENGVLYYYTVAVTIDINNN